MRLVSGTDQSPTRDRVSTFTAGMLTAGMVALLVVLMAVFLVGCGSAASSTTGDTGGSSTSLETGFSGVTLDGTEVSLSQYRGRPLVLTFMATW